MKESRFSKPASSEVEACGNCHFCRIVPAPDGSLQNVCCFDPPKMHAALLMTSAGPQWPATRLMVPVEREEWCGKYQRAVNLQ